MVEARRSRLALLLLAVPFVLASQSPAAADEPGPTKEVHRSGLTFGLGLGAGLIARSCDGCEVAAGPAVELHVGALLTPRLALLWEASGAGRSSFGGFRQDTNILIGGAVQHRLLDRLWIRGGLGLGILEIHKGAFGTTQEKQRGFGVTAATGFDAYQGRHVAVDIRVRLTSAFYDQTVVTCAVTIGTSWY